MHLDVSQVKSIACASIRLLFYPFCYCCCISPSSILETCLYRKGKRKGDSEHIDYNTMHIVWNVSSSLLMGIWFYSFTSHILNHFFFLISFFHQVILSGRRPVESNSSSGPNQQDHMFVKHASKMIITQNIAIFPRVLSIFILFVTLHRRTMVAWKLPHGWASHVICDRFWCLWCIGKRCGAFSGEQQEVRKWLTLFFWIRHFEMVR